MKKLIFVFACLIWAVCCRADVNNIDSSEANVVEGAEYEWVFVYYIALDNDLSIFGQKVLNELERGVVNSKVAVVVQADFEDIEGMKRITLCQVNGEVRREEIILDSENSADEAELRKYFEWVEKEWDAENYAVIFPNHGGRLNEMCRDDQPSKNPDDNKRGSFRNILSRLDLGEEGTRFLDMYLLAMRESVQDTRVNPIYIQNLAHLVSDDWVRSQMTLIDEGLDDTADGDSQSETAA